jgi:hypothetical protein
MMGRWKNEVVLSLGKLRFPSGGAKSKGKTKSAFNQF